ncbi:hypothetical protein E2C01_004055 [Portunus trituberculatus]|uniref:Ig-like domain-containing protein n=1 Tax=Portunus trituberculatus TaxID=210409 RepID=A0A5B7CRE2_PORTR|nr:hypothetical protein [Portunus trituberculatus]
MSLNSTVVDSACRVGSWWRLIPGLTLHTRSASSSSSSSLPSSSSSGSRVPMFVATIPNVTVTEGRDASLPCIVKDIGDYQVSPASSIGSDASLTLLRVVRSLTL